MSKIIAFHKPVASCLVRYLSCNETVLFSRKKYSAEMYCNCRWKAKLIMELLLFSTSCFHLLGLFGGISSSAGTSLYFCHGRRRFGFSSASLLCIKAIKGGEEFRCSAVSEEHPWAQRQANDTGQLCALLLYIQPVVRACENT